MLRATVLIENTGSDALLGEHGLSFYIEYQNKKYLLDAGSTDAFLKNADKLDIPLRAVDICILSHGHYDHSGGFHAYFSCLGERPLYAMEQVRGAFFSGSGEGIHDIGVPRKLFAEYEHCFRYIDKTTELAEGVYLVPHSTQGLQQIGERAKLYRQGEAGLMPDDFAHELSLVFDTRDGLVIFNSCSHGGVQNIIEEVKEILPGRKIAAFLGGFHMKGRKDGREICTFSETEVQELVTYLKKTEVGCVYTGHCTGSAGLSLLQKYGGKCVQMLHAGKIISFS